VVIYSLHLEIPIRAHHSIIGVFSQLSALLLVSVKKNAENMRVRINS